MNLLFICNQGMHRSRTAAELLKETHNTQYRGVYSNVVSSEDVAWADIIFVMEEHQRTKIGTWFPKEYLAKRIICLEIPDIFSFGQDALVSELKEKITEAIQDIDVPRLRES